MSFIPNYEAYDAVKLPVLEQIPKHWSLMRLKQVVSPDRQITYGIVQAGKNVEGGIPYIRPADMSDEDGVRNESGLLRTSQAIAASYSRSAIRAGDIVCSIGPSFGKVMVVPSTLTGANLTQGTARVAISGNHSARFCFWALRSPECFQQWESSVGGATFRALNLGPLSETFLPIPPIDEQKQIAAFLDYETAKIDALIEKQQQLIALLGEKRQAVISHAVTKGLNPDAPMRDSGVEWLGEVPEHWRVCRLKHAISFLTSGPRGWSDLINDNGSSVFLQSGDLNDELGLRLDTAKRITPPKNAEGVRTKMQDGDVVCCVTGANTGRVAAAEKLNQSVFVNQHLALIRPRHVLAHPRFLATLLAATPTRTYFAVKQYGLKEGLSLSNVAETPICLPLASEQEDIVNYLENIESKLRRLREIADDQVELLQERRTALISAAVTGKIDLRGWKPPTAGA